MFAFNRLIQSFTGKLHIAFSLVFLDDPGHFMASALAVANSPPNIIVVFTDDHGWADLGVHGVVDDIRTPNLDALAEDGVRFNAGYITAPQCIPSRAGIISGRYQQSFGVDDNRYSPMPVAEVTIAEQLQTAGYVTGMVGKWHLDPNVASQEWLEKNTYAGRVMPPQDQRRIPLSDLLPYRPGNQGFDEYFCGYIWDYWANFDLAGNSLKQSGEHLRVEETDRLDVQTDAALAFIKRNHSDPFFLYLAYYAPHVPLESSEKYLSRFPGEMPERRRYALAMISAVDEGVGRIREQLHNYGILDNTIIFFIGDNGAPLKIKMEDKPLIFKGGAWDGSLNTPLRGEKGMLSEGGIRVPFLMSWPDEINPGQVSDIPVSSLDVAATAVDVAGLGEVPQLPGENILTLLKDPRLAKDRPLFWRFWDQAAIRVGDWKYLRAGDEEFLFNISDDITESNNRFEAEPVLTAKLRQQWEDWNTTLQRPFDGDAGLLNNQEAKWYRHYFAKDIATVSKSKTMSNQPVWQARHATMVKTPRGVRVIDVSESGQRPFITVNSLKIGESVELDLGLIADGAGQGRIEYRYSNESLFYPEHMVSFGYIAGQNSVLVNLPVSNSESLQHLRIVLPFGEQELLLQSVAIQTGGHTLYTWDF